MCLVVLGTDPGVGPGTGQGVVCYNVHEMPSVYKNKFLQKFLAVSKAKLCGKTMT